MKAKYFFVVESGQAFFQDRQKFSEALGNQEALRKIGKIRGYTNLDKGVKSYCPFMWRY